MSTALGPTPRTLLSMYGILLRKKRLFHKIDHKTVLASTDRLVENNHGSSEIERLAIIPLTQ